MALSGSKSIIVTSYDTLKFSWERTSYSIANNTSTIAWKMQLISSSYGRIDSSASKKWSVTVNGTKYSGTNTVGIAANTTKTLASGSTTIKHNNDGTKSFSYSFSQTFDINFNGNVGTKSGSGTGTLDTIPRASTISATSAVVGSASTITVDRKSSGFTHTITYSCGSASGTVVTKSSSTSIKWTLPTALYAQIGSTGTSKTVTLTCTTYSGSTQVGDSKTCTLSAKTSSATCAPTLSPTIKAGEDTQKLTGSADTLIKYYSTANITFGAAARNSATLKSKKVSNSGKSLTADGAITKVTSGSFSFTVTDSRGYTTNKTITKNIINYVKLTATQKINLLVDGTGSITISGNCFNGSFGAVSNTLAVEYRYKAENGAYSSWKTATATRSGNTYSAKVNLSGFDYQTNYTFEARATDKIATATTGAKSARALPVFDWSANNFNFNVHTTMANNKAYAGKNADGSSMVNVGWISNNNNLILGGGNYPPNNIYLNAADGGKIYASNNNNETYYDLLGAAKILANTYTFDCTVKAGANYSAASATALLIGGQLRITFSGTRKSATGTGNITDETICTISFNHGGKIKSLYGAYFPMLHSQGTGYINNSKNENNTVSFDIVLAGVSVASTSFSSYFILPCSLTLNVF